MRHNKIPCLRVEQGEDLWLGTISPWLQRSEEIVEWRNSSIFLEREIQAVKA